MRKESGFNRDILIAFPLKRWKELITICDKLPENAKYIAIPPFAFTEQIQFCPKISEGL